MVVIVGRWSVFGGSRKRRFDCTWVIQDLTYVVQKKLPYVDWSETSLSSDRSLRPQFLFFITNLRKFFCSSITFSLTHTHSLSLSLSLLLLSPSLSFSLPLSHTTHSLSRCFSITLFLLLSLLLSLSLSHSLSLTLCLSHILSLFHTLFLSFFFLSPSFFLNLPRCIHRHEGFPLT
jgi:hypothetical protein